MASISSNGYAEVMAGTNNYTGSNSYDGDCPKTAIVPVASDDICNKLYVDAIVGGGTVVSVTGGTNIVMTGSLPAPTVNLRNPLTAELNMGLQSLRDRVSSVGTSGQVLTAGTGGQVLWGAGTAVGVTSITGGNNIVIDSTISSAPVVSLLSPLTSTLNLGIRNITGTTGFANFIDNGVPNTQSQVSATGLSVYDASIGSNVTSITKTGQYFQSGTDTLTLSPNTISHTIGASPLSISSIASNINLNTPNVVTTSGSFQPATILDTFSGSAGLNGQVLSSQGGSGTKWIASGVGGENLDQTLSAGNTATGAYANITLTDTSLGGSANPILTLVNTQASNASVAMEVYKDAGSAGTAGDILFNQSVYGKDAGNAKQEYTRITHSIRDITALTEDGSIEFACVRQGNMETFVQLQGVENEINFQKVLDMNGNNIRTTTGSLTITTTGSSGTGNIIATAKAGVQINASSGVLELNSTVGNFNSTALSGQTHTTTNGTYQINSTNGNIVAACAGVFNVGATTGINMTAGTGGGIVTNQTNNTRTILRTGVQSPTGAYLDYYPSYVVENSGLSTNISLPYIPFQNMTLINSGISPTYGWQDAGTTSIGSTPRAFLKASSGYVWVAVDDDINIYADFNFTAPPLHTFALAASAGAYCFHEAGGFMFVGGQFAGVTGQPTSQFSLLRFSGANIAAAPVFDPMFDGGVEGVNGQIYAITSSSTTLYVGGLFSTTFPTSSPLSNLCIIGDPYGTSGNQTYTADTQFSIEQFSTNGVVNALFYHNNGGVENVYVGGNFTTVAGGFQNIPFGAVYEVGWTTTPFSTLGSSGGFNSMIMSFAPAVDGASLLFTGAFNFTEGSEIIKYGGYSELANPLASLKSFNIAGIGASGLCRNCINPNNGNSLNFFITDDCQVWYGNDSNSWEDGGIAVAASPPTPAGILFYGTNPYALIPTTTTGVRVGIASSSSAVFTLPSEGFKTATGSFAKATLPEYAAQAFVADTNNTYWHAVGTPIATFSN